MQNITFYWVMFLHLNSVIKFHKKLFLYQRFEAKLKKDISVNLFRIQGEIKFLQIVINSSRNLKLFRK